MRDIFYWFLVIGTAVSVGGMVVASIFVIYKMLVGSGYQHYVDLEGKTQQKPEKGTLPTSRVKTHLGQRALAALQALGVRGNHKGLQPAWYQQYVEGTLLERTVKAIRGLENSNYANPLMSYNGVGELEGGKREVWAKIAAEKWILRERNLYEFADEARKTYAAGDGKAPQSAEERFQKHMYIELARLLLPYIHDDELMSHVARRARSLLDSQVDPIPPIELYPNDAAKLWKSS